MIKYIIFFLALIPITAYAEITISNADFEFDDFNLNVTTPITIESFIQEPDGFSTRNLITDDLRKYSFDNSTGFNVRWIDTTSTFSNFTITDVVSNVRGNVSGTELGSVEIDQISIPWTYTTLNIVDINSGVLVEYFFPSTPPPPSSTAFNAIVLSLAPAAEGHLGGVYAITCDAGSVLSGIFPNGTGICSPQIIVLTQSADDTITDGARWAFGEGTDNSAGGNRYNSFTNDILFTNMTLTTAGNVAAQCDGDFTLTLYRTSGFIDDSTPLLITIDVSATSNNEVLQSSTTNDENVGGDWRAYLRLDFTTATTCGTATITGFSLSGHRN